MKYFSKTNRCGVMPSSYSDSSLTTDKTDVLDEKKTSEWQNIEMLHSEISSYRIEKMIGEGSFGKVVKCVNVNTSKEVAVKVLKTQNSVVNTREIKMLNTVAVLDPAKTNLPLFLGWFIDTGITCLVFEMLDRSLHQLLLEREAKPLSLHEIRPIAQQLLTALHALKGIGVVHSDLKPDNIMLANHGEEPFRVKLIDFGGAFSTSEDVHGCLIQPLGYRAPEVTLGLLISEAIDAWGLGCLLVWLRRACHPFSIRCEYQSMKDIVRIIGQPPGHMIKAGSYSKKYFLMNQHRWRPAMRLKTEKEYERDTGIKPLICTRSLDRLNDLITLDEEMLSIELDDQIEFVRFLKSLLQTDPAKRITPREALRLPFITMAHLEDELDTSEYVKESFRKMLVCPTKESEEEQPSENETLADKPPDRCPRLTAGLKRIRKFFGRVMRLCLCCKNN